MSEVVSTPATMTWVIKSNVQQLTTNVIVPASQTMTLMSTSVIFDSDDNAKLAGGVIYIDVSPAILSQNQVIDTNPNRTTIPVVIGVTSATVRDTILKPLWLARDLPRTFSVTVYDSTFAKVTGLMSCVVVFTLEKTAIT